MKTKFIKLTAIILAVFSLTALATPAFAACTDICNCTEVSEEVQAAAGCPGKASPNDLSNTIQAIVNSIIAILGIVAVIFIIMGGVQYITSSGDATKTKKAKDTILYACIGLAVCALAFAIANFAINTINSSNRCGEGQTYDSATKTCKPNA